MNFQEIERTVISHDRQIGFLISTLSQVAETQLNQIERQEAILAMIDKIRECALETEGKLNALIDLVDRMIREKGKP